MQIWEGPPGTPGRRRAPLWLAALISLDLTAVPLVLGAVLHH